MLKRYIDLPMHVQEYLNILRIEYDLLLLIDVENGYTAQQAKEACDKMIAIDSKRQCAYERQLLKAKPDSNESEPVTIKNCRAINPAEHTKLNQQNAV